MPADTEAPMISPSLAEREDPFKCKIPLTCKPVDKSVPPNMRVLMVYDGDLPSIMINGKEVTLELGEPTSSVMEKARRELRELPEIKEAAIKELQQLIKEEDELYAPIDNIPWLVRFLRPTKFYPESAMALIKHYYQFKVKNKQIYENCVPSKVPKPFMADLIEVLPLRDQEGRRILILSMGKKWKHKEVPLDEILRGAVLLIEAAMLEPETQICGVQVVFDMDGLTMQQAFQFTPPFAKRIVDLLQDCLPLRVKGIHIINQPYVFNMVFALFKPFLRDKLRSRIYFHGSDRKSLYQYINQDNLPEQYGGTVRIPLKSSEWHKLLCAADCEYENILKFGYKKQMRD